MTWISHKKPSREEHTLKTEFLKKIGIEDQSIIDQILAENGRDIEREKGKAATLQSTVDTLKSDLEDRDKKLKDFQRLESVESDNATLRERIKTLEDDAKAAKAKYDSDIKGVKKDYLVESGLRGRGAKNTKMVKALLDMEKIDIDDEGKLTGFDEQIDSIVGDENYKFAFSTDAKPMTGLSPTQSASNDSSASTPKTFAEIISAQLNKS